MEKLKLDNDIVVHHFDINEYRNDRPDVIILAGCPASGKSTLSKYYTDRGYIRLNRDLQRKSLTNLTIQKYYEYGYHHLLEDLITDTLNNQLLELLSEGEDVVIDNTNLSMKYIKTWFKLIRNKANITINVIESGLNETIERDKKREDEVGEEIINKMHGKVKQLIDNLNKFLSNNFNYREWLKEQKGDTFTKVEQDVTNEPAVIFDIDGTLALRNDRSPFDWHLVKDDSLNKPVWETYQAFQLMGYKMIIFTGRDAVCEDATKEWLDENDIQYDEFRIRPKGNTEKDSIIKRRFLEDIIENYHIKLAVDDRKSIKRMWQQSGIFILDVNQTDEEY